MEMIDAAWVSIFSCPVFSTKVADMCIDKCMDTRTDAHMHVRRHAHGEVQMCMGMCIGMCMDTFMDMCINMFIDMCMGMTKGLLIRSFVLASVSAVVAAMMMPTVASLLAHAGVPALTYPFCFTILPFVLLQGAMPKILPVPLSAMTVPEDHLIRHGIPREVKLFRANATSSQH